MTEKEALAILNRAAASERMWSLAVLGSKINVPLGTIYHWWKRGHIPSWRLPAFDKLKKRRTA